MRSEPGHGPDQLPRLLSQVVAARARQVVQVRQRGARPEQVRAARLCTLDALRAYSAEIRRLQWPVPRGIQQEIKLLESLVRRIDSR